MATAPVYGNNGNRWWVGKNVGGSAAESTVLGNHSIIPIGGVPGAPPAGYESLPSGNAADDKQFMSAAAKNKGTTSPNTIVVEGISWFNIQGPFTTQAAANAAIPGIQKANPAPGEAAQIATNAKNATGLGSVVDFLQGLTSANLWIRVAKVLVGGVMLIVGLAKITGADKAIGGVASKAVRIAPFL